ncbi:MAG: hypothetical protein WCK78_01745 [Paludibacter sp.]
MTTTIKNVGFKIVFLLLFATGAFSQPRIDTGLSSGEWRMPFDASGYADKPCNSYSNYNDVNGKPAQILWGQAPFNDFGSRQVTFDYTGLRKIRQVPAPGIHPRILCTPDDLPEMRRRLKETRCGQESWKNLLCWTEMMKGNYDDKAEYAKPDVWKGQFGGLHSRVPLFRLGLKRESGDNYNRSAIAAKCYNSLIDGTAVDFPTFYWNVFSLEAFRCLIENDKSGAEKLAAAVVTAMRLDQAKRDAERAKKPSPQPIEQPVGDFQLAFTYDFIYQWLSPEQRKLIHDELLVGTWSHDNYGTFNTATTSRANWATFSYWLYEVLAIEGEAGFNDLKVRGMYRGWRNLFTYGWFQSGATYEGEAKNQLGMDGVLMFAMRQKAYNFENLSAHPYLFANATKFFPHSIIPTLDGFVKYDLLGGSRIKAGGFTPCDLLGLKYVYPDNKIIDFVYRSAVHDDYSNIPDRPDGYYNGLLFYLIYATDFDQSNNNPAALNLGNTFFCGERALMMTRSGWDSKDALMLNMHVRQFNGGHASSDRNAIMLGGAGRIWSPVQGGRAYENFKNSVVVIDHKPQNLNTPGTVVDFSDTDLSTFITGDAKYSWDWNLKFLNKSKGYYTAEDVKENKVELPKGYEAEKHTVNDFSYLKLLYSYLNVPVFQSPHWILPNGALSPVVRAPNYPVKKAFRTAGIVRGKHPFALVVDDICKDDSVRHYDWILTLEYDIQIVSINRVSKTETDIILTGSDPLQLKSLPKNPLPAMCENTNTPAGQPMLLVRVLNCKTTNNTINPTIDELMPAANSKELRVRRLIIPADAVSPDFKIMLFPYRQGDSLPKTTWSKPNSSLNVQWKDQVNIVHFSITNTGYTKMKIETVK